MTKPYNQLTKAGRYYRSHKERCIERSTNHRRKYWEYLNKIKAKPCKDCDIQYSPWQMDFDHRPGSNKSFCVSTMKYRSRTLVEKEIAKCDIVCANCHRQRTHLRKGATNMSDILGYTPAPAGPGKQSFTPKGGKDNKGGQAPRQDGKNTDKSVNAGDYLSSADGQVNPDTEK